MDRRLFLRSAGGVATALWIGPIAAHAAPMEEGASSASVSDPWAPWSEEALRSYPDPRVRAIAHAILVPNPQNLQPWLCELPDERRIIVRDGGQRHMPAADQRDRQLTVGYGTFSEMLLMALENEGYNVQLELFPEGEPQPVLDKRPIAVFHLSRGEVRHDPLLDYILKRHTNRTPYDTTRLVSAAQIRALQAAVHHPERVHFNQDPALVAKTQDIILRAWELSMIKCASVRLEVAHYTHIGTKAIAKAPYGPAIADAVLTKAPVPVTIEALSDPDNASFRFFYEGYRKAVQTGMTHVWIAAPSDRKGMFEAGRDWVRLHLQATALGLDMEPHSQAIQDFPQIEALRNEFHTLLGVSAPERIQMFGRIGYGSVIGPSPRLPAAAHLGS